MATDPARHITPKEEREMIGHVFKASLSGFVCVLEMNGLARDQATNDARRALLDSAHLTLNSLEFLQMCRAITGIPDLSGVSSRTTRMCCGNFVSFHDATGFADPTGTRSVNFSLNLTSHWQAGCEGLLCLPWERMDRSIAAQFLESGSQLAQR